MTWLRSARGRKTVGRLILYVPGVGRAVSGVLLAKLLRTLVSNLLAALGVDRVGPEVGLGKQVQISRLVGMIVFIFVFIPARTTGIKLSAAVFCRCNTACFRVDSGDRAARIDYQSVGVNHLGPEAGG